MVTIKEIAEKLGVSISTVSKGLNGASDISDELKQIVLDTAVEMGYSTKRSRNEKYRKLAIFVENMEYSNMDDFGYDIVLGFKQNAFRHKFEVEIIPVTPSLQEQERYDTYLLKHQYCGAFLVGFALHDEWMKQLETTTMPTILLDNFIPENPTVGYVGTDNAEGIDMAVKYLHNLGHKKIAFLNGSLHSKVSEDRQKAFESSMQKCGLVPEKNLMAYGFYVADSAKYHVPGFLSNGATAIICGNDLIASGVINECKIRGFKVPDDISVIGFDDIPIASTTEPPLSTVRQERNELGRCAFVALNSLINHIPISITLLRPQLIIRESSGCVPVKN
ncbi:LacI family DNA-binding transcriptional regulator [Lachnobacterium bovis]|uniref:Transcriptional regulator, LacI family n=1 Tax=Lachnobacterium bovis TaxID=140626 RepID=A0A1H9SN80_9FIRM|nr:LacI family DNA-binding transcriptional regulator [Lachnobacterium bovis]SER86377.1 transcriptional regulator, LacI family [Lachnobacterium bovis]